MAGGAYIKWYQSLICSLKKIGRDGKILDADNRRWKGGQEGAECKQRMIHWYMDEHDQVSWRHRTDIMLTVNLRLQVQKQEGWWQWQSMEEKSE